MSTYNELINRLVEGEILTLSVPDSLWDSFFVQLRVAKSRQDVKYRAIFGYSICEGNVIRYERLQEGKYKVWLGTSVKKSKIEFKILGAEKPADA